MLVINQAIPIDGLDKHLLCSLQCNLNGMHISEVPKFVPESPNETTYAIELVNSFNTAHPLIIPLQLSGVTSYFNVSSPSFPKYENDDFLKIYLTAEESPWDPSTNEYSERETQM